MKRYLITGGAGFIGSHLAESLWQQGHHVTVLDDFSTGDATNLTSLLGRDRVRLVEGCVTNQACVDRAMRDCNFVFHLAAVVGVELVVREVLRTIRTNLAGTEAVLEAARATGAGVIIASSSEVYGQGLRLPMREDDSLLFGPTRVARWGYAYSKAVDEILAHRCHVEHGMNTLAVRFFNVAGPRQSAQHGMVMPRFVAQALNGEPLSIHGNGRQTRCFSHVSDVVRALVLLSQTPEAAGEVINVGSDVPITINQLALTIKQVVGSSSPIVHVPPPQVRGAAVATVIDRLPDLSLLRRLIGQWKPASLRDIVADVVEEQREQHVVGPVQHTAC